MEKINIAEILKDCPKGMELDCTMYENCTFEGIEDVGYTEILVKIPNRQIRLTKEGCFTHNDKYAKCVIFPKGKTTWEGFVPSCQFKDGDIISDVYFDAICIFKDEGNIKGTVDYYCGISGDGELLIKDVKKQDEHFGYINEYNLATEEEKAKLFQAIKDNGYVWNKETKTLEKLPKFKVGDKITKIDGSRKGEIFYIDVDKYHVAISNIIGIDVFFEDQDEWKLITDVKPKFKVGYRIKKNKDSISGIITNISDDGSYTVEYQGGGISFVSLAYQDEWELVSNKFDITTLKPFDKVLVRQNVYGKWGIDLFGFYTKGYYHSTGSSIYVQCIPYEGNEHLLGTTENCDEFYKTWV